MATTVQIDISDEHRDRLARLAAARGVSLESVAGRLLADRLRELDDDPLLALSGAIDSDVTDAGVRHDDYIGQALFDELRGRPNA